MSFGPIHHSICTTCRLRTLLAAKQFSRNRTPIARHLSRARQASSIRHLHGTASRAEEAGQPGTARHQDPKELEGYRHGLEDRKLQAEQVASQEEEDSELDGVQAAPPLHTTLEEVARAARQRYGDVLPENYLTGEEYRAYERLYGAPISTTADETADFEESGAQEGLAESDSLGTGVLKESEDGRLEEVEYIEEEEQEDEELQEEDQDDDLEDRLAHASEEELAAAGLDPRTIRDLAALRLDESREVPAAEESVYDHTRSHPLTELNRFGPASSTVQLPAPDFVDPVTLLTSSISNKHISDAAHKIFGGVGLPYSTSTPQRAATMPQKAIPLSPGQSKMSEIEGDVYMTTIMPGVYASTYSVLVETRKRLGGSWLEGLLKKEGGPRILDAGGAGAGIMAAREVLQAEWAHMHDTSDDPDSFMEIAAAGGDTGGESIPAPVGKATVLTSNEALRHRSSQLLENTTFLPRLPDYVHASDESARERGKYDIVIAPHTLWPLKEDYLRKQHVENLWSLVSTDGGILVLLEKGVPRGFEMVAAAREKLLNSYISSPGSEDVSEDVSAPGSGTTWGKRAKEKGMIVAPCTNHEGCPMYVNRGVSKGRKDYCRFGQRYIRPPFLQKILGAKHRNHEDVEFSYVSVMRGRDLRDPQEDGLIQGDVATARAFAGFEDAAGAGPPSSEFDPTAPAVPDVVEDDLAADRSPHSLSLPRTVFPPLKRQGHVILDLCTPSGTLERWTVPRSFSKQAYRDARKSSWGDIWALGAKTRTDRNVRVGRAKDGPGAAAAEKKKQKAKAGVNQVEVGYDASGRIKEDDVKVKSGGRMRHGKVKGIRDKRDKTGTGRGRRKNMGGEE